MTKAQQKRTLETHSRLLEAASALISEKSFEALRVEEVVLRAGVAKGTFFSHFTDKDALMQQLIAERINAFLDDLEQRKTPGDVDDLVTAMLPMINFMTSERYIFDLILRYSGAVAIENVGDISMTFERYGEVLSAWLMHGSFRDDISPNLLAEGVQAFLVQAMALNFCALHCNESLKNRLLTYLKAWLTPSF